MKYKIIGIVSFLLVLSIIFYSLSPLKSENLRVEQHLEKKTVAKCNHDTTVFCSHLPLVSIDTGGKPIKGMELDGKSTRVKIKLFDKKTKNNHIVDKEDVYSEADVRYRGNSSLQFDKKSLLLKFIKGKDEQREVSVFGMEEDNEWILNGPFLDKSLIRDYISLNISAQIMGYAPNVRFCEVFINGKYIGLYIMVESIKRSFNKIRLSKAEKNLPETSYLLRMDRYEKNNKNLSLFSNYTRATYSTFEVKYPNSQILSQSNIDFIQKDISKFEKALYSYDYDSPVYGYKNFIDVNSFVDYMIINEFSKNYDAVGYSTYLHKDIKGKIEIGPVWDFNNSYDNYKEIAYDEKGFLFPKKLWYFMLFKDKDFVNATINRYEELRKTYLNEKYLMNYIDQTIMYLGPAIDRNYAVWGYSFDTTKLHDEELLTPIDRNPKNYKQAVLQLKTFITKRGKWMDKNIVNLKQYCHESKTKKYNN